MNNLSNIANYKTTLDNQSHMIFLKYVGLIHEFIQCTIENIYIQNTEYLKYVIIKGIKNIEYIFNLLILYTKNLDLTIFHCQKSILYYIEFIGQIGENNQNFLNLNSKDAILFLFKKTIFMINPEYRTTYEEDPTVKEIINTSTNYINIYNNILFKYINNYDFINEKHDLQKIVFTKVYKIVEVLIQYEISYKNDNEKKNNKLEIVNDLIDIINNNYEYLFVSKNYLYLIEYFIKKNQKKDLDIRNIRNKFVTFTDKECLSQFSVCKIYNTLIA